MAMQTGLEGKPWWQGAAVGALVGGAIVALFYFFMAEPRFQRIQQQERKMAELQAKITEGRAAKEKLPQFREEVRRLELELEKLLRILPARRNTPELMRRIRQLAEQSGFVLLRFTPGNFIDREFYREWPITVSVTATYHNLAMFFDRVGRFSRIINIDNLRVGATRANRAGHTVSARFVARTFIYREKPPAPPPAAKGKPRGRR
jgi:type IV pilus assembly protein PilO